MEHLPRDTEDGAPPIQPFLEGALIHRGVPARIASLTRRPSQYRTSCPLEEVDLRFDTGSQLSLVFKDLSPHRLTGAARLAKPEFLRDPRRELDVYTHLLDRLEVGTATCYGTVADEVAGRFWLFLERVSGVELYQVGAVEVWQDVARWLAAWHSRFPGRVASAPPVSGLIVYDEAFYRCWSVRALEYLRAHQPPGDEAALTAFARLTDRYDRVVETLLSCEATVLHGEFYASNIMVTAPDRAGRVCPVDWEMAAIGPGLMDLAALTSGTWSEPNRRAIATAYRDALPPGPARPSTPAFFEMLDVCRLHVAMQWLGWAKDWSPPPEHTQNWLGESLRLADRLGL